MIEEKSGRPCSKRPGSSGSQPSDLTFLMGGLFVAGQSVKVFYGLPHALVGLLQAVIVLSVTASDFFVRYRMRRVR